VKTLYIDPGESRTGWALFEDMDVDIKVTSAEFGGQDLGTCAVQTSKLLSLGLIETELDKSQRYKSDDHAERCMHIARELQTLVINNAIARIVAEFPSCGAKSARAVAAMARAGAVVAAVTALNWRVAYARFTPRDVKLLSTGNPNATKEEVEKYVLGVWPAAAAMLPKAKCRREHICDALAIRCADEKRGFANAA
jgi:Holliday junction resolvasome RuvABC endonuclease subunit